MTRGPTGVSPEPSDSHWLRNHAQLLRSRPDSREWANPSRLYEIAARIDALEAQLRCLEENQK